MQITAGRIDLRVGAVVREIEILAARRRAIHAVRTCIGAVLYFKRIAPRREVELRSIASVRADVAVRAKWQRHSTPNS